MIKRTVAIAGLSLLLGACGFQLRGTDNTQFALPELDVQARDAYGDTAGDLKRTLENSGVRVHTGAPFTLDLVRERTDRRAVSYTRSARTAEYELTRELAYQIRGARDLVLLEGSVEVQKVYVHDSSNVTGTDQESLQLQKEMRRDLVQQLALRLRHLTPAELERRQAEAEARAQREARALEAQQRRDAEANSSPVTLPRP